MEEGGARHAQFRLPGAEEGSPPETAVRPSTVASPRTTVRSGESSPRQSTYAGSLVSISSMVARMRRGPKLYGPRLLLRRPRSEDDSTENEAPSLALEMLKKVAEKATYTRCYCEENVYLLCQRIVRLASVPHAGVDWRCFAVFITNEIERCPVWRQKAAPDDDAPCLWDYHVVCYCVSESSKRAVIVDLDTTLPVVCDAFRYCTHALSPSLKLDDALKPKLRVVPGPVFLRHFASDRRHMRHQKGWISMPPAYAALCGDLATSPHTLDNFRKLDDAPSPHHFLPQDVNLTGPRGVVMDLDTFFTWIELTKHDDSILLDSSLHHLATSHRPRHPVPPSAPPDLDPGPPTSPPASS